MEQPVVPGALTLKEKRGQAYIGNLGGGHVGERSKRETLEEKLDRLAQLADTQIREERQKVRSYVDLLQPKAKEAVEEIVGSNFDSLNHEFGNRGRDYVTAQVARMMATRLRAIELLVAEDKYKTVDKVQVESPGFLARLGNKEEVTKYKTGCYLAVTFKGSIVMVDSGAFGDGGRVVYKRMPMRGTNSNQARDFDMRLARQAVSPDTLAVGKNFNAVYVSTSEVMALYFLSGASLSDESVNAMGTIGQRVDILMR